MSVMGMRERGDLAEEMLPVAAGLVAVVHGDGGREDVGNILRRLDDTQKNALLVVLAGLVDPDRPVGEALGWMTFDEYGRRALPPRAVKDRIRDLAQEPEHEGGDEFVDENAVAAYAEGRRVAVTDEERLLAVVHCVGKGLVYQDIDRAHGLSLGWTSTFVSRLRRLYEREGRVFPKMPRPNDAKELTEEQVVDIRTRSANGTPDLMLGLAYDMDASAIGHICRGRKYPEYGGPIRSAKTKPSKNSKTVWAGGDAEYAQAS